MSESMLEIISNLSSLMIAVISLFISLVALKVARRTYTFSSKDYPPDLTFTITADDDLEIVHRSNDLFSISRINFIKIRTLGFEDKTNQQIVQVPFVIRSVLWRWINAEGKAKKVRIKSSDTGPCAYLCPYDARVFEALNERIENYFGIDSTEGSALPSLQNINYIVEVIYTDSFQERKSVIFCQVHLHGHEYEKVKITENELTQLIDRARIPSFETADALLKHIRSYYGVPFDRYFQNA